MPKATQSLGWVEEKLRRVFNLAGPIGLTLEPQLRPVILVDDLRDPGHAFYQGRGFVWLGSRSANPDGEEVAFVKVQDDVTIDGMFLGGQVAGALGQLAVYTVTPDDMASSPPNGNSLVGEGMWRDRRTTNTDQPPLVGSGGFGTRTGSGPNAYNIVFIANCNHASDKVTLPNYLPIKLFLPRGSGLVVWAFHVGSVISTSWAFYGRVFPQ